MIEYVLKQCFGNIRTFGIFSNVESTRKEIELEKWRNIIHIIKAIVFYLARLIKGPSFWDNIEAVPKRTNRPDLLNRNENSQ